MPKSPLKYHGGKSYLAAKFVELFPPHTRYCEPFFGGGSVLFARDGNGVAEFVNDLNYHLTNFWNVLQNDVLFEDFKRIIDATPFSSFEFSTAKLDEELNPQGEHLLAMRAACFFVRNRQSRQGLGKDFATPTKRLRRGMNENVSAWLSAVDGLPEVHARLRRVEIRNQPAIEFIRELDLPDALFYCDPPYLHETRVSTGEYRHEMTASEHKELLNCLNNIKGKFVLSGYRSVMYDNHADEHGWNRVDFEIDNKASGKKKKEVKVECVWMNY